MFNMNVQLSIGTLASVLFGMKCVQVIKIMSCSTQLGQLSMEFQLLINAEKTIDDKECYCFQTMRCCSNVKRQSNKRISFHEYSKALRRIDALTNQIAYKNRY